MIAGGITVANASGSVAVPCSVQNGSMPNRCERSGDRPVFQHRLIETEAWVVVLEELGGGLLERLSRRMRDHSWRWGPGGHADTIEDSGCYRGIRDRRQDRQPPLAVGASERNDLEDALQEIGPGCPMRPAGEVRC